MPAIQAVRATPQFSPPIKKAPMSLAQEVKDAVKADSLSKTDSYVRSANRWDGIILGGYNSYKNTQKAIVRQSSGRSAVGGYKDVLGSAKRAALQRTVLSSARNGWSVLQGEATLAEAGGRIVGDVSSAAIKNSVGAVVGNAVVMGLTKAGASSFPVMAGGMVVGWGANYLSGKALVKFGVQQAITNKTTELLQSIGGSKSEP